MTRTCASCGASLGASAMFCGSCGRPQPAAPPPPAAFAPPPTPFASFAAGSPPQPGSYGPPASAPAARFASPATAAAPVFRPPTAGQGTTFEILKYEMYQLPKITLATSAVSIESGQLHYMVGSIEMTAKAPSLGGIAKSMLTKEKAVRPVYQGSGEIYLEPTFGECNILELNGEEWILDRGCYLASDMGVELGVFTNSVMNSMFGGEGMFQTRVGGRGKILYWSQGPVQRVELQGQTLVVDGSFAVARTASLNFKVERAAKGLLGGLMSGEGLVNTFQGWGTVIIAPIPNRFMSMVREFGGVHAAIRKIHSS